MPRLANMEAFRAAVSVGVTSRDFFGIAYGQVDGRYESFQFGESTSVIFDDKLLLIEPKAAAALADVLAAEKAQREKEAKDGAGIGGTLM